MAAKIKWYDPTSWFKKARVDEWRIPPSKADPAADYNFTYTSIQTFSFTGEKNQDSVGPLIDYKLAYNELRIRSWQALLESDFAQIGINKLITWVIGKGLKMQAEPQDFILNEEGITLDKKKFSKSFEARFALWKKSKCVDYSGHKNLNQLSKEAEKNAMVGGDMLVILRVIKGELKIQHVDGEHVQSPYYGSEWFPKDLGDGHTLIDGVELNEKREHIAYWVKVYAIDAKFENLYKYKFERIPAKGDKTGILMAYLYYCNDYRINNVRGMPLLTACFEKLVSMDEYSTATLKQAQEGAKVDYQQVTELGGIGTPSWAKSVVEANNGGGPPSNAKLAETQDGAQVGKTTKISTIGTVYNNPPGSEIKILENKNPLYFKEFFETHSDIFFAVIQLSSNIAMGKYTDSYSASRAGVKDSEHIFAVKQDNHYTGYLAPIVNLYLDLQILQNKIQAPGYIHARSQKNELILDCYRNVRFVGPQVPGIDPLKDVKAAREKLGEAGKNLPLADLETVIESMGGGDAQEVLQQFSEELALSKKLGIKPEPVLQQVTKNTTKSTSKKSPSKKKPEDN